MTARAPAPRTGTLPGEAVPGELALIETIRRRAARPSASRGLRLGIGDDCAILRPLPRHEIVVTTDFSLENRHFRREWHPPQSVGHRCLARGLSDLAAMGAEPLAAFLSLALPARLPARWLDGFMEGLLALAAKHSVPLAGGDTAQSPTLGPAQEGLIAMDIVAIGQVPRGKALLRSAARPGDQIWVTGALGGAAAELLALDAGPRKFRKFNTASPSHPHLYPEPRLAVGHRLRGRAHAMIDLSDGLSTDLTHLCRASGLSAEIEQNSLPIHPLAAEAGRIARVPSALDLGLNGGEDYELLFTAPASARIPSTINGVPLHRIGAMRSPRARQPLILLKKPDGTQISVPPGGWEHFRAG